MMRRREFLGAAGAVGLGGLFGRWTKGERMGLITGWIDLAYGTDLVWACGSWDTPAVLGNGTAGFQYRRVNDIAFWRLGVTIGSTTSFPNSSAWTFSVPREVATTIAGVEGNYYFGTGRVLCSAATDPAQVALGQLYQDSTSPTGTSLIVYAPNADNGSGQLSSVFPGAWTTNNSFGVNGWSPAANV